MMHLRTAAAEVGIGDVFVPADNDDLQFNPIGYSDVNNQGQTVASLLGSDFSDVVHVPGHMPCDQPSHGGQKSWLAKMHHGGGIKGRDAGVQRGPVRVDAGNQGHGHKHQARKRGGGGADQDVNVLPAIQER